MMLKFKEWLLREKAERTAAKVPLYPPLYHTKQYGAAYHVVSSADYITYMDADVEKFVWTKFNQTR